VLRAALKSAFALALYARFPSSLSRPLGAFAVLSKACRPSQASHQARSPRGDRSPAGDWGRPSRVGLSPAPKLPTTSAARTAPERLA